MKTHTGTFRVGKKGIYSLTVSNRGLSSTTGLIAVTDPLPAGLTFLSARGAGWACSVAGQTVACFNRGPLLPLAKSTIRLTVSVGSVAFPTLTNTASVTTAGDVNKNNDVAADPTTVAWSTRGGRIPPAPPVPVTPVASRPPVAATPTPVRTPTMTPTGTPAGGPDLALTKTHSGTFRVGTNGLYTLTVSNAGQGSTTGMITVTDRLPNGLAFLSGVGVGWTCSATGQTVTCTNLGPLAPRASTRLRLTVSVGPAAYPSVTNTAQVFSPGDTRTDNKVATNPTTVTAAR